MASTQLQRTAVTSTENYKYTFSAWVKRTGVLGSSSVNEVLFSNWNDSSNSAYIRFEDQNDNLHVYDQYNAGPDLNYQTNMKFRDPNAWYHIVVNVDGTRSANTRCKIYVNGSEVSCSNTTDTGGTLAMKTVTTTNAMRLGAIRTASGAEYYFSGLMSHVHYIDGTGYDASYFGETDSTTGEWKIKTNVTGVTYGNNGFFVLKDGNSVTDQSPNTNNFTVAAGTLTKTEDNPSNVFCTLNPLVYTPNPPTFSNGNTKFVKSTTGIGHGSDTIGTLGAKSGKYYFEMKTVTSSSFYVGMIGDNHNNASSNGDIGGPNIHTVNPDNAFSDNVVNNGSSTSITLSYSANDIFGLAFDLDNGKWYFHINGTYHNSGDPTSGSTGTGSMGNITTGELFYLPFAGGGSYNHQHTFEFNFGNGFFGSTQISSAGTNASGNGIFEYDCPNGYTALSTKGLNS